MASVMMFEIKEVGKLNRHWNMKKKVTVMQS
jgi:hypothetical protein